MEYLLTVCLMICITTFMRIANIKNDELLHDITCTNILGFYKFMYYKLKMTKEFNLGSIDIFFKQE